MTEDDFYLAMAEIRDMTDSGKRYAPDEARALLAEMHRREDEALLSSSEVQAGLEALHQGDVQDA